MTFTSFTAVPGAVAGEFDGTLNFTILKDGLPFTDFASLDESRFLVTDYDSASSDYVTGAFFWVALDTSTLTQPTDGNYVITTAGLPFDPTVNGQVYGYIAQTPLLEHAGSAGSELPAGTHVHLYEDVANAALAFGDAQAASPNAYVSAANVSGCEKCHGVPYLKHGYRAAQVEGLPDFAACKSCHLTERGGFVEDWQYMVDEPLAWATGVAPVADYSYQGTIMNDTHMSHVMEFPYPQSGQNCATCHEGKLNVVLADAQFTAETCLSCHPVNGTDTWPEDSGLGIADDQKYFQPNRAPALAYLWTRAGVEGFHSPGVDCQGCHTAAAAVAPVFTAYHTGYDVNITDPAGVRYADTYTVSIDAATYDPATGLITVDFSASDPAIVPELYISFYGWNSKNFIVDGHVRDSQTDVCTGRRPGCQMEYVPESRTGSVDPNPIFTEDAASSPTAGYKVTADPSQWLLTKTPLVPDMIADGTITRIEVMVAPELNLADLATPGPDLDVVLTGKTATLNLVTNLIEDDYFKGVNAAVSTAKCNVCHDALASSFHSESGRGGDGIELCKNCHNVTYPGSHVEMASRSIDNYVHAIHSFQEFDVEDVFNGEDADGNAIAAFDPVFAKRYDQHINHVFPNFTIRNCEACHVTAGADDGAGGTFPVVYNVPDQSQSMPSVLSVSDNPLTWYDIDPTTELAVENAAGRNISGAIPEFVTGAASRACGGCHRARFINRDLAGDLAGWNAHTESFGTYVENGPVEEGGDDDGVLYGVIFKIMEFFK
jgi:OmcA/MtrC family decaheme c-type cytochrome